MAQPNGWIGLVGIVSAMGNLGESAPANDLFEHFGLTVWIIETEALQLVAHF